jgi:hypothetical protein
MEGTLEFPSMWLFNFVALYLYEMVLGHVLPSIYDPSFPVPTKSSMTLLVGKFSRSLLGLILLMTMKTQETMQQRY